MLEPFRAECLDQQWFTSLGVVGPTIEAWHVDYNYGPRGTARQGTLAQSRGSVATRTGSTTPESTLERMRGATRLSFEATPAYDV